MIKASIFIIALNAVFFLCCKKNAADSHTKNIQPISLSLSRDTVYTGVDKAVSIKVNISSYADLQALIIRKGTKSLKDYARINAANIKNDGSYIFNYTVNSDDNFSFSALGVDGKEYGTKFLYIDNRTGIFPLSVNMVARETGKSLVTGNIFTSINPNRTDEKYDVGCTDLGIMWAMDNGRAGIFFGDTQGKDFVPSGNGGGNGSNWRSNVLAFSDDSDLSNGLIFSGMAMEPDNAGTAGQIIHSDHITDGTGSFSAIPTAAIHAGNADYVHYMDVRQWGDPGKWTTNFSSLYRSVDGGQNWVPCPEVRFSSNSNFSQVCYAKKDGYVYMLGTVSGRFGAAYLARFKEADILDQPAYEYWNNTSGWIKNDETKATPVLNAPVGELSLIYNTKFSRWIVTYLDVNRNAIVLRDAKDITGTWSDENILVSSAANNNEYAGLYGGFMYPLKSNSDTLYFNMSLWYPYNVFLMKAVLKEVE